MSNCNKSITHNKIASFVKSIKSSTQLVLRQICTEGKHTQYQWTKQGLKGEQICQKQGCFIRPPLTGQRHKLMLPYPRFCSGVAGFAGAGDGVSLLSGLGKKLGPISPARQPSADRSCQNPLPSYFLTKLPFFRHFCQNLLLISYFLWSCVRCPPKLGVQASSDDILLQPAK